MRTAGEEILIIEFGAQYTQLIARRLRRLGCYAYIVPAHRAERLKQFNGKGVILSGSHHSVMEDQHKDIKEYLLQLKVPILGICYGMHLLTYCYGGKVEKGRTSEYGNCTISRTHDSQLLGELTDPFRVWMSHRDETTVLPTGFIATARSEDKLIAAFEDQDKKIFAVQFHPEVSHTMHGMDIFKRFAQEICKCRLDWTSKNIVNEIHDTMAAQVHPQDKAVVALSGGVDSTIATILAHRIFGDRLIPIFVDNGLLREGEAEQVVSVLSGQLGINIRHIQAAQRFLNNLKGIVEPEEKRLIVGRTFVEIFEEEAQRLGGVQWLIQGTIYPDVIESGAVSGAAAQVIKSHHNVGGLPASLKLPLLEPLRMLFKDEVRDIGWKLGVPGSILKRHPFPGPGLAVRILGEVREEFLSGLRQADNIFLQELVEANYYDEVSQAFCVFIPLRSVGVTGDGRSYGYIISLRAVVTEDFMTAQSADLPHELMKKIATRILNEVPDITRVVYDCSSKPPATVEWE